MEAGVTSTNSSWLLNSRASSRLKCLAGTSRKGLPRSLFAVPAAGN
ncbi:MAG: hypothetical protein WA228_06980 [Desulfobaccales bacterium]